MSITDVEVQTALSRLIDPNTKKDFLASRAIKNIEINGNDLSLDILLGYPAKSVWDEIRSMVEDHLRDNLPSIKQLSVNVSSKIVPHAAQRGIKLVDGIKNIIAVASGKGGVGKSTTAVNIALALAAEGARVGILDADIYGPSQPTMMGIKGQPVSRDGKSIEPMQKYGLQVMSIGFMIHGEDVPMVWRGPMVTQALDQLLNQTHWDALDYLIVDMPPGTGDIQLTLSQKVPVTGAIIVTTPQDIALMDARKGLKMFEKVNVPVLGIVENMSVHVCSNCGHAEHIFGTGGGERMATQYGVELLGALPLDGRIREEVDGGRPTVVAAPDSARGEAYLALARRTAGELARRSRDRSGAFPKIIVEDT